MHVPAAAASTSEEPSDQEKNAGVYPADEVLLNVIRPDYERPAPPPPVEPLYDLDDAGKVRGKHSFHLRKAQTKKYQRISNTSSCFSLKYCFACVFRNNG